MGGLAKNQSHSYISTEKSTDVQFISKQTNERKKITNKLNKQHLERNSYNNQSWILMGIDK